MGSDGAGGFGGDVADGLHSVGPLQETIQGLGVFDVDIRKLLEQIRQVRPGVEVIF